MNKNYTKEELLSLKHNDHRAAFYGYLNKSKHSIQKNNFLMSWIKPNNEDYILECGSSSGKTCIEMALRGANVIGIDFDPQAIAISLEMKNKYFPKLNKTCQFVEGDLENMKFPSKITKIIMPDFTEHIPDQVFKNILSNIKKQLPGIPVYIYTPDGAHIFELLKKRNFILKNPEGHINVKTTKQLKNFVNACSWNIQSYQWLPSHIKYLSYVERFLSIIPIIGIYFRRRIAIIVQ